MTSSPQSTISFTHALLKPYKRGMFCPSNARVSAKNRPLPKHICCRKNHNTCSKLSWTQQKMGKTWILPAFLPVICPYFGWNSARLLPIFLQKWARLKKWGTQHHIFFSSNGNRSTESLSSNYMFWIGIFGHEHLHIWEVGQQDHWIWPNLDHWKALVHYIIYPTSLALEPYRALPSSALTAFLRYKGFSIIGWTGMQHLLPREGHQWQTW